GLILVSPPKKLKFVLADVVLGRTRGAHDASSTTAFTLTEVLVAIAIIGLVFTSILTSYVSATDRSEWSGYSLAAQSLAVQGMEQARCAKWDPQASPVVDDLGETNYTTNEQLDITASRQTIFATNY